MTDTIDDTDQDEPQDDVTGSAEPVNAADDAPVSIEPGDPVESSSDVTDPQEPETFPRDYVEQLRQENGKYRQRAQRADELARQLHTELVRATGRLADPSDLPFAEEHLDDPDALAAAVEDLLARKPHLASRRPTGGIGQGASPPAASSVDLAALLRGRAR